MPVTIPAGFRPQPPPIIIGRASRHAHVVSHRVELLDRQDNPLRNLDGVTGGTITWRANSSIKGTGSIQVVDVGEDNNWLSNRVKPYVTISQGGVEQEYPLGVYLCATPTEKWSGGIRQWDIELTDKLATLDQDAVLGSFSVNKTELLEDVIKDLIQSVGQTVISLGLGGTHLASDTVWEPNTPKLKIVNDLLAAAGYFSLNVDNEGRFRAEPYVEPAKRPVELQEDAPFNFASRVLQDEFSIDTNAYDIPNRYVAVSTSTSDLPAWTAVATNEDPTSPFSFQARGRWITHVETDVEVSEPAVLETRAKQGLAQMTQTNLRLEVRHPYLPGLRENDIVEFVGADLSTKCAVSSLKVTFDQKLCETELQVVNS